MSIGIGMGVDAGTVAGEGKPIFRDEPIPQGGDEGSETEYLLEAFFIMEGELIVGEGISNHRVRDPGMLIGEFLSFSGFPGKVSVFILWEKILPAGFLGRFWLRPEPVDEVKIRAERRQGGGCTANEHGKKAVSPEFFDPGGKTERAEHHHKDKRADDLGLVFGRPADRGIKGGKVLHGGVKVKHAEFVPDILEFKAKPYALRRIKMNFCLMQEMEIILMGLPVN